MRIKTSLAVALLVSFVLLPAVAHAEQVTHGLRDVTLIGNARGETRVLFRLDDLNLGANTMIGRATLFLPFGGERANEIGEIQIHPIMTAWSAGGVGWNQGWTRPGGDIHDELYSRVKIDYSRGAQTVGVDLTVLLKEILEEGMSADGFLLTVPPYRGEGITAPELARLQSIGDGTLELVYRRVPRPPPHAPRAFRPRGRASQTTEGVDR